MSKGIDISTITTDFSNEEIILGIDEAGRGPVLGPMVYACAYWAKSNDDLYHKYFKFDDSKRLSAKQREKIFNEMKKYPNCIRYDYISLSPETISIKMLQKNKTSLNSLAFEAACSLIRRAIANGANITKVCVDTVGPPDKYKQFLKKNIFKKDIEYHVAEKADALYPSVSAASEVAKVTRDEELDKWNYKEEEILGNGYISRIFGSGYPADPKTKQWLQETFDPIFGFPSNARFSWITIPTFLKKKNSSIVWEGETCFNVKPYYKGKNDKPTYTPSSMTQQSSTQTLYNYMIPQDFYSKNSLSLNFTL